MGGFGFGRRSKKSTQTREDSNMSIFTKLLVALGLKSKPKNRNGIKCSDHAVKAVYERAIVEANRRLNKNHFPRTSPFKGELTVEVVPNGTDMITTQANEVGAAFGSRKIQVWDKWKTNFELAVHECTHILMYQVGYRDESARHDRRAFPKGGTF
jgi:hypothetical protein